MMTGASAAMIALSSIALMLMLNSPYLVALPRYQQIWPLILMTSTATLLVMSLLHSQLGDLYAKLTESEAQALADARRDALTQLGNRKFLVEELERCLMSESRNAPAALLFLDLDHFKRVNDTFGHAAGDQLIVQVADRLRECASDAVIARLGGDEFALILDAPSTEHLASRCIEISRFLSRRNLLGEGEVQIGVSIGAALLDHSLDPSNMMRRADIAMYEAKTAKVDYRIVDQEMLQRIKRRTLIEHRLRLALKSGSGLSALFQSQVTRTGEVVALEALLRWKDDQLGDVSPLDIVTFAEEACLIDQLGSFMAHQACSASRALPDLTICLNVASSELLDSRFADRLAMLMQEQGIEPERMQLEISERIFVERGDAIVPTLQHLAEAGFSLAVDNYGTSTSSLSYLQRLKINTVKLDRTLLDSTRQFGSIAVIQAKVALAKSLGLTVVCGGISDADDRSLALQAGCDLLQGFYYSMPKPLEDFADQARQSVVRKPNTKRNVVG